eukprot:NODE_4202_length_846_cov_45.456713_g3876_i0.p1 GENE.NODE_4202_length_846_cov_45.456713_g3876_i0~~NODE_4202_length_846_cov_45.456713_g3876_i0.p1  ORF type:complete len:209 (+),score=28.76 NODE_4202_length_846_cov_45.456713_g3876_i0:70-696(+)
MPHSPYYERIPSPDRSRSSQPWSPQFSRFSSNGFDGPAPGRGADGFRSHSPPKRFLSSPSDGSGLEQHHSSFAPHPLRYCPAPPNPLQIAPSQLIVHPSESQSRMGSSIDTSRSPSSTSYLALGHSPMHSPPSSKRNGGGGPEWDYARGFPRGITRVVVERHRRAPVEIKVAMSAAGNLQVALNAQDLSTDVIVCHKSPSAEVFYTEN